MSDTLTVWPWDDTGKAYGAAVTKSFADWGIADDWSAEFVSGQANAATLQLPGNALAVSSFTRRSRVKIICDGKPFFHGYVQEDLREKTGGADLQVLQLAGIWWFLENTPFRLPIQTLQGFDGNGNPVWQTTYCTHFALNAAWVAQFTPGVGGSGGSVSYSYTPQDSRQMLKTILDNAKADGAWLDYADADLFEVPIWAVTVQDITYADAIRRQIENYDCVVAFDESVTPPKIKIYQRKNQPALTRALCPAGRTFNPAAHVESYSIKPRGDLQVAYVQILYEISQTNNGVTSVGSAIDVYPNPKPADNFQALTHTVPLGSLSGTTQRAFIQTAAIYPESLAWWLSRKPETNPAVNPNAAVDYYGLAIIPGSGRRALDPGIYPNQVVAGGWSSWMGGYFGRDHVVAQAQYHRKTDATRSGTRIPAHTWRTRVDATNLNFPNGLLASTTVWTGGYVDPSTYAGMAQQIYTDLNPPGGQWEGVVNLIESTFSGSITMGQNFNLTGALAAYAAMAAPIQSIGVRRKSGGFFYRLQLGPNKTLHPQQIMARMQAARYNYIVAANPFAGGGAHEVVAPQQYGMDDNSNAEPATAEFNVHEAGGDPTKTGNVRISGNGGDPIVEAGLRKSDGTLDGTKGAMTLQPVTQIAATDVAAGTPPVQLRAVGVDTNGKPCYVACSGIPTGLGGGSGSAALQSLTFVSDSADGDFIICSNSLSQTVYVKKPWKLRASLAGQTIRGVVHGYSYTPPRVAYSNSAVGYFTRTDTYGGVSETQVVIPDYLPGDVILATTYVGGAPPPQSVVSVTVAAGGSGYAVGNTLTLNLPAGTGGTTAQVQVSVGAGGAVTGAIVSRAGYYTSNPGTYVNNVPATGGSGNGAQFNVTFSTPLIDINNDGRAWAT